MAKKKMTDPKIAQLKRYYAIGQKAVKQSSKSEGTYARGVIAKIAAEEDLPVSTVEKCRLFAQRVDQTELKQLCNLERPSGQPMGWGHVTKLITVSNSRRRQSLSRRVAENDWSARRLEEEIHSTGKPKQTRGSTHSKPTTTKEAYRKIASVCDQWLRWAGDFGTEPKEGEKGVWLDDMPENVQKRIRSVERAMNKLRDEVH